MRLAADNLRSPSWLAASDHARNLIVSGILHLKNQSEIFILNHMESTLQMEHPNKPFMGIIIIIFKCFVDEITTALGWLFPFLQDAGVMCEWDRCYLTIEL